MNELTAARTFLTELWADEETPSVLCAVSGGLDSMCLIHFLTEWGRTQGVRVTAAHFNHQIRGEESDRDEQFVRTWCAEHDVPFVCGRGDVPTKAAEWKRGIEETAREMALGAMKHGKAEVAVAVTGIAGPTGGTPEKPVGLVYVACVVKERVWVRRYWFGGDRTKNRENTTTVALAMARNCILEYNGITYHQEML